MSRLPGRQGGLTLLLLLVLLVLGTAYAFTVSLSGNEYRRARTADTADTLALAKASLMGYALTYRDINHAGEVFGYLPCPDTQGDGVAHAPCGATGKIAIGLLPYRTLGLPLPRDADGNCLWYVVSGTFKASSTSTAKPMNWDTQGQLGIVGGSELPGDPASGGVAAVVIAPGPALVGHGLGAQGPCRTDPAQWANFVESYDQASARFTPGVPGSANNDTLIWITAKEVFERIKNRSDFGSFIGGGINDIRNKLNAALPATGTGNSLPAANLFDPVTSPADFNFYENWKDQFRYLPCAPSGSYCYRDSAGRRYDAVLMFGGADVSGNPRGPAHRQLADYFESGLEMAKGNVFAPCSATAVYDNTDTASRAKDLALCLSPAP